MTSDFKCFAVSSKKLAPRIVSSIFGGAPFSSGTTIAGDATAKTNGTGGVSKHRSSNRSMSAAITFNRRRGLDGRNIRLSNIRNMIPQAGHCPSFRGAARLLWQTQEAAQCQAFTRRAY